MIKLKLKCRHCKKELTINSINDFEIFYRNVDEKGIVRTFCNQGEWERYWDKFLFTFHNGHKIYKIINNNDIIYLPYIASYYGFKNLQECKHKIDEIEKSKQDFLKTKLHFEELINN